MGRPAFNSSSRELVCYNCQGKGHHYKQCPSPRQNMSQPTTHFTHSPDSHIANTWTLDSGANHHLTNNLANLHLHSEYQGTDQVQLTDGNIVAISHSGSSIAQLIDSPRAIDEPSCS
ncbi:Retrovirus-related Pol polyprotein from transposon RE2 [Linum perenne]